MKLGAFNHHSLDSNGSSVYKHASEEDTYLSRSPTGNWMVSLMSLIIQENIKKYYTIRYYNCSLFEFIINYALFSNQVGPEIGTNQGWIQHIKCNAPCPEMCTFGWQYSNGIAWNNDESMKPTCGKNKIYD